MPTEEEKDEERASRLLIEVATSTTQDLYALLNVPTEGVDTASLTENELNRAWKKAALKWHPDKNPGNEKAAADKIDEIRKAFDVLRDPAARRAYEDRRRAKREKVEREQAFDEKRRRMKEDLERREGTGFSPAATKRKFDRAETEDERRERELKRIAAEGARRRADKVEALRRAARQEEREREANGDTGTPNVNGTAQQYTTPQASTASSSSSSTTAVPEVDRTVKVRWPRDDPSTSALSDKDRLSALFSTFGPVESVLLLKDKKARSSLAAGGGSGTDSPTPSDSSAKRHKKQLMATGVVVFTSIVGAHAAVLAHEARNSPFEASSFGAVEWAAIGSVEWAAGPPASLLPMTTSSSSSTLRADAAATPQGTPSRAFRFSAVNASAAATPSTPSSQDGDGLRRVPSFASFGGAAGSPGAAAQQGQGKQGPSLFEVTMMRLKEAERRRLEEVIRRQDEEEEHSVGGGGGGAAI